MNNRILIFFSLLLLFPHVLAASKLDHDSLFNIIYQGENDSLRIEALIDFAEDIDDDFPDSAFIFLEQAEGIAQRINNVHLLSEIHLIEGRIFATINEFADAAKFLLESKRDVESIDSYAADSVLRKRYVEIHNQLGVLYFKIDKFDESLEYQNAGLRFMQENNMMPDIDEYKSMYMMTYINIGAVYIRTRKFTEAEINYTKALSLLDDDDLVSYAAILNNLGIIAKEQEEYDKAMDYHNRARKIREESEHHLGLAQTYNNIGATNYVSDNFEQAKVYFKKSLELSREHGFLSSMVIALHYLNMISEAENDYRQAYEYQSEYILINDSLMNEEKLRLISQMEMQDKFDARVRESLFRQEQLEQEQRRKESIYFWITFAAILGLLVLVLVYSLQRSKMKRQMLETRQNNLEVKSLELEKQNLERELEFRTKELATNVMYMARTSEFITRISEKLLKSKMYFTKDNQEVIHKIITELQTYVDQDTWSEFEIRFQQVHNDFYTRLNQLHPDLTANEKKLCAFLRLNMTTKEISAITYQSINSIVVARSRLRKKLDIDRDENLVAYLENLQ